VVEVQGSQCHLGYSDTQQLLFLAKPSTAPHAAEAWAGKLARVKLTIQQEHAAGINLPAAVAEALQVPAEQEHYLHNAA
jgi:hypothetical protein